MWRPVYIFAAVDHAGADITLHQGDTVRSETVDGGGYPVHKPASAGWNGYGDLQHTTEEAVRMNVRAVARSPHRTGGRNGRRGGVRLRRGPFAHRLWFRSCPIAWPRGCRSCTPEHVAAVSARARSAGRLRRSSSGAAAARSPRSPTGSAARRDAGPGWPQRASGAVCAALREGAVDTLIVGDLGDATVVTGEDRTIVAPDADVLSELGEAVHRVVRADEALPFAAIAVGAAAGSCRRRHHTRSTGSRPCCATPRPTYPAHRY